MRLSWIVRHYVEPLARACAQATTRMLAGMRGQGGRRAGRATMSRCCGAQIAEVRRTSEVDVVAATWTKRAASSSRVARLRLRQPG